MTSTLTTEVTEENTTADSTTEIHDVTVTLRLPTELITEMEEVIRNSGFPSRSAYIRRAIQNELRHEERRQELEALEWEQRKKAIRRDGSDDPFPKEQ